MRKHFTLSVREGRFLLQALVAPIGDDLLVSIWGGTHPHIGAVALALPRPSLRDKKKTSATSSVLTVLGHKEDQTVKFVSEILSAALNKNTAVTAGIHWDQLRPEEINVIIKLTEKLTQKIINKVKGIMDAGKKYE
jgi:gallate decarboxylase subunit D